MGKPIQHERFMRLFVQHEGDVLRDVLAVVPHGPDARDVESLAEALPLSLDLLELGNLSLGEAELRMGVRYCFFGALDEVLIVGRALSPAEVRSTCEAGEPRKWGSLVASRQ